MPKQGLAHQHIQRIYFKVQLWQSTTNVGFMQWISYATDMLWCYSRSFEFLSELERIACNSNHYNNRIDYISLSNFIIFDYKYNQRLAIASPHSIDLCQCCCTSTKTKCSSVCGKWKYHRPPLSCTTVMPVPLVHLNGLTAAACFCFHLQHRAGDARFRRAPRIAQLWLQPADNALCQRHTATPPAWSQDVRPLLNVMTGAHVTRTLLSPAHKVSITTSAARIHAILRKTNTLQKQTFSVTKNILSLLIFKGMNIYINGHFAWDRCNGNGRNHICLQSLAIIHFRSELIIGRVRLRLNWPKK